MSPPTYAVCVSHTQVQSKAADRRAEEVARRAELAEAGAALKGEAAVLLETALCAAAVDMLQRE